MLSFLKSRRFLINIVLAAILFVALLYLVFAWMNSYTNHGESYDVPDITKMPLNEAINLLDENGFRYQIEDSVYSESHLPGVVVRQMPEATFRDPQTGDVMPNKVKQGRRFYLIVNKKSMPIVSMPKVTGKSKKMALAHLSNLGLEMEIKYKNNNVCDDCVLEQRYNGNVIKPGDKIRRGEKVTIVLGKTSGEVVSIPDLVGMKLVNAQQKLISKSLNVGRITGSCNGCLNKFDTLNAYIVKQVPSDKQVLNLGDEVHLTISTEKPD